MHSEGFQSIKVVTEDTGKFSCMRCDTTVKLSQIAAFTRTNPSDPFEPWCHECFLVLVQAARVGLELADSFIGT